MKEKILVVEDQFIEANNLQEMLEMAGYRVCEIARSVPKALKIIAQEKPDFVLLDIFLQGPLTGIDLAQKLNEQQIPFLYLSANSNKETLDAAKATNPYGFLVKPFRQKDVLVMLEIARHLHEQSLKWAGIKKMATPPEEETADSVNFHGIIGKSALLRKTLSHLQMVAPTSTSVLILGESGTGKERIAACLHELSLRKNNPLIKVNCAALPEHLVESILFGHERGSFTGATERRTGKFEQAHQGTIFLDEIGELSLEVQVKLLRVLQEKEIERIGGTETLKTDARIIAATNRNLEKEVAEGRFRMDLYYRLNVFPLQLPPLRNRKEDIPVLAHHFLELYASKIGKNVTHISNAALDKLTQYHWPGNIRELEHCMERAVLLNEGKTITQIFLPEIPPLQNETSSRIKTMEENERAHISAVLKMCDGKISGKGGAAEILGMNVSTLNFRIKKLGINKHLSN